MAIIFFYYWLKFVLIPLFDDEALVMANSSISHATIVTSYCLDCGSLDSHSLFYWSAALECFSVGDGSLREDAWFYEASNFVFLLQLAGCCAFLLHLWFLVLWWCLFWIDFFFHSLHVIRSYCFITSFCSFYILNHLQDVLGKKDSGMDKWSWRSSCNSNSFKWQGNVLDPLPANILVKNLIELEVSTSLTFSAVWNRREGSKWLCRLHVVNMWCARPGWSNHFAFLPCLLFITVDSNGLSWYPPAFYIGNPELHASTEYILTIA